MNFFSYTIPANQGVLVSAPGKVLTVKSATAPLTVAFNGGDAKPVVGGTVLSGPFDNLNFVNPGSVPVTVTFFVGDNQVPFSPGDNSTNNAKSYLLGNLGQATSGSTGSRTAEFFASASQRSICSVVIGPLPGTPAVKDASPRIAMSAAAGETVTRPVTRSPPRRPATNRRPRGAIRNGNSRPIHDSSEKGCDSSGLPPAEPKAPNQSF